MIQITLSSIVLGEAIPFSIYDKKGVMLFRKGAVIRTPDQKERLVMRGAFYNKDEVQIAQIKGGVQASSPLTIQAEQSPFEHLSGLSLDLKQVMDTALKRPEQIDIPERIGKIAQAIQEICQKDIDSALAAPFLDFHNPYIMVHQVMGAVLTEIIAYSKGLKHELRQSLVCAALTRDFGQISIQAELDNNAGPLTDILRERMCQHPNHGAKLLESAGVTDQIWLQTVREHHECLNGSGYPSGLKDGQVSLGARILAVADTYSAMVKPRPYRRKAHIPQSGLKEIFLKKDAEIDGEIARILISKIGILPPGTLVKLKCGEIAVVKSPALKAEGATVYSIYGKSGTLLTEPVCRETSHPAYEITGTIDYSECRAASLIIKQVWTKRKN